MDKVKGKLLVIIFLGINASEFAINIEQKAVSNGDNVTLHCSFNKRTLCSWSRKDEKSLIKVDGRYHYVDNLTHPDGNSTSGDCSINIHGVNETLDLVLWTCSVKYDSDTKPQKIELVKAQVTSTYPTTTQSPTETSETSNKHVPVGTFSTESTSIDYSSTPDTSNPVQGPTVIFSVSNPGLQSHILSAGIGGGIVILLCITGIICFLYWRLKWTVKRRENLSNFTNIHDLHLQRSSATNEGYTLARTVYLPSCSRSLTVKDASPRQSQDIAVINNVIPFPSLQPKVNPITSSEVNNEYQYENISGNKDRIYYEVQ